MNLERPRLIAVAIVFLWFMVGGVAHFATPDVFVRIVPPWVPCPRAVVLVSGALEVLGALGILLRPTRRAAGIGLLALTVAVTPANVWMLQQHADWPDIPRSLLVARLALQAVLLVLIAWCTGVLRYRSRRA